MATPVLESSAVPLGLIDASGGGPMPVSKTLSFVVQHQLQTNWCWAAVTASIASFYRPSDGWTQCRIVNDRLGQAACCQNGSSMQCNQPWYLDRALTRVGHLSGYTSAALSMSQIRSEIDAGRPLGIRIGWVTGGGHFVGLRGYSDQGLVDVQDPWYGAQSLDYATFRSGYHGVGKWTHSYRTISSGGVA